MQRKLDRLSVGIIPEQPLDITDTSLHWLFGKDGGYVTRLNDDYAQDTPNDNIPSAKSEARITREIGDWMQSQECDEFWAPRARQPRRVSSSEPGAALRTDKYRNFQLQTNYSNNFMTTKS